MSVALQIAALLLVSNDKDLLASPLFLKFSFDLRASDIRGADRGIFAVIPQEHLIEGD